MPRRSPSAQPPLIEALAARAAPSWCLEEECRAGDAWPVAGVDEAGRGPLAGPVVAAAVVLPFGSEWPGLADSKQLRPQERARLAPLIRERALAVGVGIAAVEEIDAMNILRASHLAMARALEQVGGAARFALVDGLPPRGLPCPHRALPRGDALCISIAAASVIAKVTRDRLMEEMDREHPGYGFARHKGYPTPAHLAALAERGPCPVHRRSFRPVAELLARQQMPNEEDPLARLLEP
jgi:ribonuclease HII